MKYFDISEFDCQETGKNWMNERFLLMIDELRYRCGFPFVITSGYRSPSHSVEIVKIKPGQHTEGRAADIQVNGGAQRFAIVKQALAMGFTGIGIAKDFIHVDTRRTEPMLWVY